MFTTQAGMNNAVSPISRLPIELLSEIFSLCALSADSNAPGAEPTPSLSNDDKDLSSDDCKNDAIALNPFGLLCTIRLATVCRRWRAVILAQASLWADVCVTEEMLFVVRSKEDGSESLELDTTLLQTCLQRSRGYPLNIVIDARDPEWNWTEDGVGQFAQSTDATDTEDELTMDTAEDLVPPPFTPSHMVTALSLLLPHLHRWRSLAILTDTWAPMHAALRLLNPALAAQGAPMLERIALMRCNELPSYWGVFQPEAMRDPPFLAGASSSAKVLPKLKHLALEGVHADWDALPAVLRSGGKLESLTLRYHSMEVRPAAAQYRSLLASVPKLQSLSLRCSGTRVSGTDQPSDSSEERITLAALRALSLGYQTPEEGIACLEILNAPELRTLDLQDKSHWARDDDAEDQAVEDILALLSESPSDSTKPAFPHLAALTLTRIPVLPSSMHAFLRAHPRLVGLALNNMPAGTVRALLPATHARTQKTECVCPALRRVRVAGVRADFPGDADDEGRAREEARYYVSVLQQERAKCGAAPLEVLEFECAVEGEVEDEDDVDVDESAVSDAGTVDSEEDEAMVVAVRDNAVRSSMLFQPLLKTPEGMSFEPTPHIFQQPAFGAEMYDIPTLVYP